MSEQGLRKTVFFILRNTPRAFRLVWETSRVFTLLLSIFTIIQGFTPLAKVWVAKLIMDSIVEAIRNPNEGPTSVAILSLVALEVGIVLGSDVLNRIQAIVQRRVNAQLAHRIQSLILEKVGTLDIVFFETPSFHDQIVNAQQEAGTRPLALVNQVFSLGQRLITLTSFLATLTRLHIAVVGALFIAVVPNMLVQGRLAEVTYQFRRRRTATNRRMRYVSDLLVSAQAVKEIKLLNLSQHFLDRFRALFQDLLAEEMALARRRAGLSWLMTLLSTAAFYGSYAYMIAQTVAQAITLGDMALYVGIFRQGRTQLRSFLGSLTSLYENNLYLSNLYDFLALEPQIKTLPGARPAPEVIEEGIEFRNVSFRYPGQEDWALRNLNLYIKAGESIALLGVNGTGKSTFIKLLTRLYDPIEGDIFVDGVNLKDIDPASWQAQLGVIFQDHVQYQMSVGENIGLGRVEAMEDAERIRGAAELSGMDETIEGLPRGYETPLGRQFDDGVQLSGGQWQRIALARAFVRDAPIMVLDEPAAAMDPVSQHSLLDRLEPMIQDPDKTTIVITHRFTTVYRCCQRILVIEDGRILEDGTHEELMALEGAYATMYRAESATFAPERDCPGCAHERELAGLDDKRSGRTVPAPVMPIRRTSYDAIIIGGGPAGLTAALYTAREGLDTLILEKGTSGGKARAIQTIENYPGFDEGISGREFAQRLTRQAQRFGVEILQANRVTGLHANGQYHEVLTADGISYAARTVLIATGARYRRLNIPGELELVGVNIHYCATCAGALYRNREVLVIGGSNRAFEEALSLTRYARRVIVVDFTPEVTASPDLQEKVAKRENITVVPNHTVQEFMVVDGRLAAVKARDRATGQVREWHPAGVFVFLGMSPNSGFLPPEIERDGLGFIATDRTLQTSIQGVFAAGDVRAGATSQLALAASEGAAAALMMRQYLESTSYR